MYITIAEADAYNTAYVNSEVWEAAEDDDKTRAIKVATQYLDAVYGAKLKGERADSNQGSVWPRLYVTDWDGIYIDHLTVPVKVKQATAEAAIKSLTQSLIPDSTIVGDIKKKRVKVDVLEQEFEFFGAPLPEEAYRLISKLMEEYLESSNKVYRL